MKKEKYQALNTFWTHCGKDGCNESELQEALNVFRYNRYAYEQKRKRKGIIIRCMKYADDCFLFCLGLYSTFIF